MSAREEGGVVQKSYFCLNKLKQKTLYRELKWKYAWQGALESCCWKHIKPSFTLICQEAVPRASPVCSSAKGSSEGPVTEKPTHAMFGCGGSFKQSQGSAGDM